jgi:hypothetical protein
MTHANITTAKPAEMINEGFKTITSKEDKGGP